MQVNWKPNYQAGTGKIRALDMQSILYQEESRSWAFLLTYFLLNQGKWLLQVLLCPNKIAFVFSCPRDSWMMSPVSSQRYMIWGLVPWVVVENRGVRCLDQLSGVKMNTWSYCWSWGREPTSFTRLTRGSQSAPTCRLTRSQNHGSS